MNLFSFHVLFSVAEKERNVNFVISIKRTTELLMSLAYFSNNFLFTMLLVLRWLHSERMHTETCKVLKREFVTLSLDSDSWKTFPLFNVHNKSRIVCENFDKFFMNPARVKEQKKWKHSTPGGALRLIQTTIESTHLTLCEQTKRNVRLMTVAIKRLILTLMEHLVKFWALEWALA